MNAPHPSSAAAAATARLAARGRAARRAARRLGACATAVGVMAGSGCAAFDTAYRQPPPAPVGRTPSAAAPAAPRVRASPAPARAMAPAAVPEPARRPPVASTRATVPAPAAPESLPPLPVTSQSMIETLALQVYLDRQGYSCNAIDGRWGPKTRQALEAWQEDQGLPVTGRPGLDEWRLLGPPGAAIAAHVVTPDDLDGLADVPDGWRGKAALAALAHATALERLAERHHASEGLLHSLNPDAAWPNPPPGASILVPDVGRHGPPPSASRIRISLSRHLIEAFGADGRRIALFPCSIARDREKRPVGELRVQVLAPNPNYTFDPALFAEDPESASIGGRLIIPPGPNNPVGTAWIGLDRPGYGMHGTPRPEDIGKTQSHGCFRLANWNAERLLRMVSVGTPVEVVE